MHIKATLFAALLVSSTALPATPTMTREKAQQYGLAALYVGGVIAMGLAATESFDLLKKHANKLSLECEGKSFREKTPFYLTASKPIVLWSLITMTLAWQAFNLASKARQTLKN